MKVITSVTDQPKQRLILKLDNNEPVIMNLYFYPTQHSWYFDIEYNEYVNRGNKVVLTMNALRHLKNRLPFGIAFVSGTNAEPFQVEDFVSGAVLMLLLNEADVNDIEETVYRA